MQLNESSPYGVSVFRPVPQRPVGAPESVRGTTLQWTSHRLGDREFLRHRGSPQSMMGTGANRPVFPVISCRLTNTRRTRHKRVSTPQWQFTRLKAFGDARPRDNRMMRYG